MNIVAKYLTGIFFLLPPPDDTAGKIDCFRERHALSALCLNASRCLCLLFASTQPQRQLRQTNGRERRSFAFAAHLPASVSSTETRGLLTQGFDNPSPPSPCFLLLLPPILHEPPLRFCPSQTNRFSCLTFSNV